MDDALSTLKAEIATKKQKLQAASTHGAKYIRLGEVERQREAEYLKEQQELEEQRHARLQERLSKYKTEAKEPPEEPERRKEKPSSPEKKVEDDSLLVMQSAMNTELIDPEGYRTERTKELVILFAKRLCWEWRRELEGRPEEEGSTVLGKKAWATYVESVRYLRPLYHNLQSSALASDLVCRVTEIFGHMQKREYVSANDVYLRMSIGNAPWPIGVTSVGIHERSAHDKLSKVAHALNDETTRKWIQSIKRLLTLCQKLYPPTVSSQRMG